MSETHSLELGFCPYLLASMKALVPGTESEFFLEISKAKLLNPVECGNNPLNDLVLFQSSMKSRNIHDCKLSGYTKSLLQHTSTKSAKVRVFIP